MTLPASLALEEAAVRLWDVLVVGAGPAGALAARELARRGLAVLLVDRAQFPRWKVCGACLSARALATLASVGLESLTEDCHAMPLAHLRLAAHDRGATLDLPGGVALSRETFDAALVRTAISAGAAFLPGTYATLAGVDTEGRVVFLRQGAREWRAGARLVIAADGLGGRLLAGESHIRTFAVWNSRIGAGTIAAEAPGAYTSGTIYMACGPSGYVGLVRLEDNRLDIAAAFDRRAMQHAGGPAVLAAETLRAVGWPAIPGLSDLAWRGTPALTRRASPVAGERLFVVGDSAGYIEPFTGEGMAWALEAAVAVAPLAVEAVGQWTPRLAARWTSTWRRTVGERRACRTAARVLRSPRLTRSVVSLLERFPALSQPVIRRLHRSSVQKAVHA
jgi:flavin-dependent dehydrogenase